MRFLKKSKMRATQVFAVASSRWSRRRFGWLRAGLFFLLELVRWKRKESLVGMVKGIGMLETSCRRLIFFMSLEVEEIGLLDQNVIQIVL